MANETVLFKRGDSATITSTPITDGQILFDTSGNGKMYLDNGTTRLAMGGSVTIDSTLSKTSTNAVQNKAVTGNILNSLAEVSAATQQNTIAGALALKEVNSSLGGMKFGTDGDGNYGYYGADGSLIPFSSLDGLTGEQIGSNTKLVKVTKDLCGILFLAKYVGWYDYFFYKNGNKISSNASAVIGDSSGKSSYFGSILIIEDFKDGDTLSITTNSDGACRIVGLIK